MASVESRRRPKIVVLGSINMDLVATMRRMPEQGETVHGDGFFTAGGGKGANQAVAAARLGADVRMVGRVGDDDFGRALVDGLRVEGIDARDVAVDVSNATGVAMIMVDAAGQNRIAAVYGANMTCDEEQLEAAKRAMEGADVLMLQLEIPPDRYRLRRRGMRGVWECTWCGIRRRLLKCLKIGYRNYADCSDTERDGGGRTDWDPLVVTDVDSARVAADVAAGEGSWRTAVVKLGEQRCVRCHEAREEYIMCRRSVWTL